MTDVLFGVRERKWRMRKTRMMRMEEKKGENVTRQRTMKR
jgi:hypothetical protein